MEGLLLAAGAGRRMGTPKALVSDDEGSWLLRAVANLVDGGCHRVTVVLGAEAERASALLEGAGVMEGAALLDESGGTVRTVLAADWAEGMGASLRAGLEALVDSTEETLLLSLVDLPDLVPEVVARVGAVGTSSGVLARASYDGVPGHPVLIGRDHWPGVLASAHGEQGARTYLRARDVRLVECGDLATGRDVDSRPTSATP